MTERGGCDEFAAVAAELALGVLTGRERADALAHLDGCEPCRETVHQLTLTGEGLLWLLPAAEPPPGFESRVLARVGLSRADGARADGARADGARAEGARADGARAEGNWGRRVLAAAAVVAAVLAAGLGGWGLRGAASRPGAGQGSAAASPLRSAELLAGSRQVVGEVFYYNAGRPWMYVTMSMYLPAGGGNVKCELEGPGGRYTPVGSFRLDGGYASWGGAVGDGPVTGARIVSAGGTVLATASFRQGPRRQ